MEDKTPLVESSATHDEAVAIPAKTRHRSSAVVVTEINDNDVFMGRGKRSHIQEGNIRYRKLIKEKAPAYGACLHDKKLRKVMAHEIMRTVQQQGGRFLRRLETKEGTEQWEIVPESVIFAKVKQSLRDTACALEKETGTLVCVCLSLLIPK